MKRIAIISDVHGNLEALNAVLLDIKSQGVDDIFCLGDTVGYGPFPGECLEIIKARARVILKGNHEEGVLDPAANEKHMTKLAMVGVRYSIAKLSEAQKIYIASLPTIIVCNDMNFALVHGAFSESGKYIHEKDDAEKELGHMPAPLCCIGHTHIPFVYGSADKLFENLPDDLELNSGQKFLVNAGSVGQPRDGDCRASYAIIEQGDGKTFFNLRRVFYDIGKIEKAIREAGLPHYLSERLFRGE